MMKLYFLTGLIFLTFPLFAQEEAIFSGGDSNMGLKTYVEEYINSKGGDSGNTKSSSTTEDFNIYNGGDSFGDIGGDLPVSFLFFQPTVFENSVALEWATATEENNDFFTIEKSVDRKNWTFVASKKGAGNSNTRLNYKIVDSQPFKGVSFYRLKQSDYDGTTIILDIQTVNTIATKKLLAFPNPTVNELLIVGNFTGEDKVRVFDIIGKEMSVPVLSQNTESIRLQLRALQAGQYIVVINNKESVIVLKK
ncbi:T9SS type A sorting domain-containing protein [Flammeovirga sp. EKP202]|uniref:T9SS type A sorting domain-containing protein n=1 Tax=Flammeovirga sp. EKP202 TaxID=2770592 RepID=UPI00165ED498|nr:T9SS type A sorting domain-containing protein [Flammeovirga sp. EKP202]MBD0400607.1 T9SS type A sorting domain-containing protein [Flammeovirga sp. EKP202]